MQGSSTFYTSSINLGSPRDGSAGCCTENPIDGNLKIMMQQVCQPMSACADDDDDDDDGRCNHSDLKALRCILPIRGLNKSV